MISKLPTEPGKYRAAPNVILYVSRACTPYFLVIFHYKRNGKRNEMTTKFYVRDTNEFMDVQRMAVAHARELHGEIRKAKLEFLQGEILRKEAEHRSQLESQQQNAKRHAEQARRDVQRVWAIYGPELDINKPFFIYQWGG